MNYKGKRNPYRLVYLLSIAVWAVFIVALLLTMGEPAEEPVAEAEEVVAVQLYQIPVVEQVEEPDDQVDLTKLKQTVNATVTAYCVCKKCCGKDESHPAYGITASGRPAEPYVSVAVDPFLIELGSMVYIDYGDGELLQFRADDTGSGVAGTHIDVCYPDHQSALEHGVKTARVYWEEKR